MVKGNLALTLAVFASLVSGDYVKYDAKKLKGSWAQNADTENFPLYGVYQKEVVLNSTAVNGTAANFFNDKVYYAVDLKIGSDNQSVTVLVDTGSSDLWVNSKENDVCAKDSGSSNYTIEYEYTISQSSTSSSLSSSKSSSESSKTTQSLKTSYVTSYNSESDEYVVVGHISTDTTSTTVKTSTHVSTTSYDTQFYPSVSGSSSSQWLSSYAYPTFTIDPFEVLDADSQNCSAWGLFDTDSSDTFIELEEDDDEEDDDDDKKENIFEAISVNDDYEVSGIWGKDTVSFGNATLTNVTFGVALDSDSDSFGVLGLGLKNGESSYLYDDETYDNFPFELKNQGYINKVVYSIYDNYLTNGSSLLFGGIDLSHFVGNLSVVPLIEVPFMFNDSRNASAIGITLSSITFNDNYENVNETGLLASGLAAAIIDTSSSIAAFPYYIYDEIVLQSGFKYSETFKAFIANSTQLENKTVTFDFQGSEIEVPVLDLTIPLVNLTSDDVTEFAVFAVDATPDTFILGDAILQYMYIAIDLEDSEIAIAEKNFFPESEDIVAVSSTFPNATTASSYNYTYGYHDVTELKLATVHNPNSISRTSFPISYSASATPYSKTVGSASSRLAKSTSA